MENQESYQNKPQDKEKISQSELIDINETAIIEYLNIVKNEYDIERSKKQSFENRAGLILALLSAICVFLFEHIRLSDIILLMNMQLSFAEFFKIISGILVYISFVFTIIMIIKIISVKQYDNFEVKDIDEELISEQRISALCRIVFTYKSIILQHREMNEIRAKNFKNSLYGIFTILITIIIYITL